MTCIVWFIKFGRKFTFQFGMIIFYENNLNKFYKIMYKFILKFFLKIEKEISFFILNKKLEKY